MLTGDAAAAIAQAYGLGEPATLSGPVARGQLGQVWRLTTPASAYAVKEWFASPDAAQIERDAEFSEQARAAGVLTPAVVRTRQGEVVLSWPEAMVRVFEWVDLAARDRALDPVGVGRLLAHLHRSAPSTDEPVGHWFADGVGADTWHRLLRRAHHEQAPFAGALASLVDDLVAVEAFIEPPRRLLVCHRDLWADNVLAGPDGRPWVVDFENIGPADPSHELAMVLFEFGLDDPARVRALHRAYVDTGGPGRVRRPGHFSMLIAEQAHIGQLATSRWVGAGDPAERDRLAAWFMEIVDDPVTPSRIDRVLAALP